MTTPTKQQYGFGTTLPLPIEQALTEVTAALKEEGFGVLTTIDVQQTMKQKLDVEFEPYYILGACNPRLAHRALETVHDLGLLLPCNVIVRQHGAQTRVEVADPLVMLGIVQNAALQEIGLLLGSVRNTTWRFNCPNPVRRCTIIFRGCLVMPVLLLSGGLPMVPAVAPHRHQA